jgi:hypothetical protein
VAEGQSTLPVGLPDLTLGWGVIENATQWLTQPDGPQAGQPWVPTDSQIRYTLWWYSVGPDGRWLFHHGVRRLAKGSGKSPFAAVFALEELIGPVRLNMDRFDGTQASIDSKGGSKPVDMPLVQVAATALSQTANTMRMIRAMATKKSRVVREHQIDVGKTVFYTQSGGQLEVITSSAAAAEGALVTFAVEDETELWTPGTGGPNLAGVLDRNLAKSSSRGMETANAWEPGSESVAESTFNAWQAQQEGRTKGKSKILYDARVAPADTDLTDEESLTKALTYAYGDCRQRGPEDPDGAGGWVDLETIKERIWDPRNSPDVSRRFYLNQPTASEDAWTTPMNWRALDSVELCLDKTRQVPRQVQDGEEVVLFFDGSKSRDATGIVGCCMSDGHIFTVGSWEPDPRDPDDLIPVNEVDATVARAFDKWSIMAFFADVKEWEGFTKVTWPTEYGDKLLIDSVPGGRDPQPIAWDMRSHGFEFTVACELTADEILERSFTHDGDPVLARHVANARRRAGRYGISIGKESKDSPKKIDLAVCMIGARMVRRLVLASKEWEKRQHRGTGRGRIIVLS